MSHLHEREEKICLNCGTQLTDRYCQKCGQENIEPKPTLGHLIKHFFNDVTHFDGRFFVTMKMLIVKPGFLSSEYLKGKRTSYLDPIRMFLFISATFFLLFLNFDNSKEKKHTNKDKKVQHAEAQAEIIEANKQLRIHNLDTLSIDTTEEVMVTRGGQKINVSHPKKWSTDQTTAEYDSTQNSLPEAKRDGWLEHYFKRKFISAQELSRENQEEFKRRFLENVVHSAHMMLFFTLPLIAFILFLLYIRRKQFYYVSHIIFTLHCYCVVFLGMMLSKLMGIIGGYASYVDTAITIGYFVYPLIAMKRFYKQGLFKTFVKYVLLLIVGGFFMAVLVGIVVINSFLNVAA